MSADGEIIYVKRLYFAIFVGSEIVRSSLVYTPDLIQGQESVNEYSSSLPLEIVSQIRMRFGLSDNNICCDYGTPLQHSRVCSSDVPK